MSYVDQLVQYELRLVLKQINEKISKKRVHALELTYASLIYDEENPGKMVISGAFFNEHIKRPVMLKPQTHESVDPSGLPSGGMFAFLKTKEEYSQEEPEAIPNTVLVCITKTHLVLLKEKWD